MKDITYAAPKTVADATGLLNDKGDRARILAGGTDIIVQVREGRRDIDALVDIKHIAEVNELSLDPAKGLTIGAAVPCCLIYENKAIARAYPGLIDAASLIGGMQIQSRASLGGNLCNASPAADGIPVLIALEGVCDIAGPKGTRSVPIEQFCSAPGKTVLQRGEFLLRFRFPPPKKNSGAAYLRFIPRNEMDIAVVGAGVAVQLDAAKSKCTAARIALAAVAPTPLLVLDAGAALVGTALDEASIAKAANVAQAAARPISDMRGDADYRRHLVGVLVKRALAIAIDREIMNPPSPRMSAAIPGENPRKDPAVFRKTLVIAALAVVLIPTAFAQRYISGIIWPQPPVVTPGENNGAPSDAIVLFDGKNFDAWKGADNWKIDDDGGFTAKGRIETKKPFGDCQLHVEWASPKVVKGSGQGRGNNGIGLMGAHYEIQVLDSYQNPTYFEGQAGAVYNQTPPMVNASKKPGEWQTYDILFTAPRFDKDGKVEKPAFVTVLHNGVLVQNHTEIIGSTHFDKKNVYEKHAPKLPIVLMYHGDPVRFRNIWIREFKELEGKKK